MKINHFSSTIVIDHNFSEERKGNQETEASRFDPLLLSLDHLQVHAGFSRALIIRILITFRLLEERVNARHTQRPPKYYSVASSNSNDPRHVLTVLLRYTVIYRNSYARLDDSSITLQISASPLHFFLSIRIHNDKQSLFFLSIIKIALTNNH